MVYWQCELYDYIFRYNLNIDFYLFDKICLNPQCIYLARNIDNPKRLYLQNKHWSSQLSTKFITFNNGTANLRRPITERLIDLCVIFIIFAQRCPSTVSGSHSDEKSANFKRLCDAWASGIKGVGCGIKLNSNAGRCCLHPLCWLPCTVSLSSACNLWLLRDLGSQVDTLHHPLTRSGRRPTG